MMAFEGVGRELMVRADEEVAELVSEIYEFLKRQEAIKPKHEELVKDWLASATRKGWVLGYFAGVASVVPKQ